MTLEIESWIDELRTRREMTVHEIDVEHCAPWALVDGSVERPDKRFFRVVGVQGTNAESIRLFIDQPEIGVLAFIFARLDGRVYVLSQAKDEPGNQGITQLAPTIQATRSNFELAHGGEGVPYFSYVTQNAAATGIIHDSQSSEHGERFWRKHNRNLSLRIDERISPISARYRWFPFSELCAEMDSDFLVNTDARSVLSSTPWAELVDSGRRPFDGTSDWCQSLEQSFHSPSHTADVREASAQLFTARRQQNVQPSLIPLPLERLANADEEEWLTFIDVTSATREVDHWRQPIYKAKRTEKNCLLLARRGGERVAILRLAYETGLTNGVEWSVTSNGRNAPLDVNRLLESGVIEAGVRQTEEGSRFFHCLSQFDLVVTDLEVDADSLIVEGFRAVTLGALNTLAGTSGMTTNELRTAMSLLLKWL